MREFIAALLFFFFMVYVMGQYLRGCGEHYIDSEGVMHLIQCD